MDYMRTCYNCGDRFYSTEGDLVCILCLRPPKGKPECWNACPISEDCREAECIECMTEE